MYAGLLERLKWNGAIINVIIIAFPALTSQNVCSESRTKPNWVLMHERASGRRIKKVLFSLMILITTKSKMLPKKLIRSNRVFHQAPANQIT